MSIKKYNEFYSINEKSKYWISWKELLLMFGIGLSINFGKNVYKLHHLYSEINSDKSIPNSNEERIIDTIRQNVISNIKSSNLFKKLNREFIIDSITNIQFKLLDSIDIGSMDADGVYIHIDKKLQSSFARNEPNSNNYIIIKRDLLNDSDVSDVISHEIYHYFDVLSGNNGNHDIKKLLDKRVLIDKKYALNKISLISCLTYYDSLTPQISNDMNELYGDYMKNKNYYLGSDEVFARWNSFKYKLLKDGFIKDINQKVSFEEVISALSSKTRSGKRLAYFESGIIPILFFINIKKINEVEF